jgi:hypothetical protein
MATSFWDARKARKLHYRLAVEHHHEVLARSNRSTWGVATRLLTSHRCRRHGSTHEDDTSRSTTALAWIIMFRTGDQKFSDSVRVALVHWQTCHLAIDQPHPIITEVLSISLQNVVSLVKFINIDLPWKMVRVPEGHYPDVEFDEYSHKNEHPPSPLNASLESAQGRIYILASTQDVLLLLSLPRWGMQKAVGSPKNRASDQQGYISNTWAQSIWGQDREDSLLVKFRCWYTPRRMSTFLCQRSGFIKN